MSLIKREPWCGFRALRNEMNRLIDGYIGTVADVPSLLESGKMPPLDISETETTVTIRADLPGIDEEDVTITLTGETLTIKGEKKRQADDQAEHFHRLERAYGSFQRTLALPGQVDHEKTRANFKNGVLEIFLPKIASNTSKAIKIKVE